MLFRAFIYDCYSRNSSSADLIEARRLLETTIVDSFAPEEKWKLFAATYERSYWQSNSKDFLQSAIKYLELYVKNCTSEYKKEVATARIKKLKSRA